MKNTICTLFGIIGKIAYVILYQAFVLLAIAICMMVVIPVMTIYYWIKDGIDPIEAIVGAIGCLGCVMLSATEETLDN